MAKKITLENSIEVEVQQRISINTNTIIIEQMIDDGSSVTVYISFESAQNYRMSFILWQGDDYVAIGQWTDNDVKNKIIQLLGGN